MKKLTGSEKQVKWAEDIIAKWQERIEKEDITKIFNSSSFGIYDRTTLTEEQIKKMFSEFLNNFEKASEVIDLRSSDVFDLAELSMKSGQDIFFKTAINYENLGNYYVEQAVTDDSTEDIVISFLKKEQKENYENFVKTYKTIISILANKLERDDELNARIK